MSNRYTIKDLRIKAARLNTMAFGDSPDAEQQKPHRDGRFFVQGADARVGGYNLFRQSGAGWDSVLYGRSARELFDLMDAFEQGYRFAGAKCEA